MKLKDKSHLVESSAGLIESSDKLKVIQYSIQLRIQKEIELG